MLVLGIETSCDETGIAIYDGKNNQILSNQLNSQMDKHKVYGGVVPEIASRNHIQYLPILMKSALEEAHIYLSDLDAIAYTAGPGLLGALITGGAFAASIGWSSGIPVLPINHMEGHLLSTMLEDTSLKFPFVTLLVSGGHTQLVYARALGEYEVIGNTLDDAAGEAFDKIAKLLNLGYPGGPIIEKIAKNGNKHKYTFPRPMTQKSGLDFSFSGLKTAVVNKHTHLMKQSGTLSDVDIADVAASAQEAIVQTLAMKCHRALKETNSDTLVISGGVAANQHLRTVMKEVVGSHRHIVFPRVSLCTDNGMMIAYAGYCKLIKEKNNKALNMSEVLVEPRWSIDQTLSRE